MGNATGMLVLGLLATQAGVQAAASSLEFDFKDPKEISAVSLTLDSKLEPIVGYAKGISGSVHFDPANPKATTGSIAVEVASVQFANEGYTATARGYALNGEKYPRILFTLRKVVRVTHPSADVYQALVQADFTCKGITLPLTVPVTASYYPGLAEERTNGKFKGDVLVLRTKFDISRKKLGISEGIPDSMVGDTVQVGVAVVGLHYTPEPKKPQTAPMQALLSPSLRPPDVDAATACAASESQTAPSPQRAQMDQPVDLDITLPEIRTDKQATTRNLAREWAGKPLVLFFFSEQCGVTFRYKQRLQQLQKEFEGKGFTFVGVRCGKREKPDAPLEIAEAQYLKMPFLDDANGALLNLFHVRQSLTFAVIDKTGKLRYRGGFDDNVEEKRVTKPYLRNALRALADGKAVTLKEGRTLGCAILPIE